jgi:tripartite-type tricarboxylate transporter receptor subunit TctC
MLEGSIIIGSETTTSVGPRKLRGAGIAAGFALAAVTPWIDSGAHAQGAAMEQVWVGKQVRIVVGYNPPSTFDTYARLLARHYGAFVPGRPNIIVQAVPGAGGINSVNYMANVAPRDGSTLALINASNVTEPLLDPGKASFDATKFGWIGSMNSENTACGFWAENIQTIDDLKSRDIVLGATGPGAGSSLEALALQSVLGFRFRLVQGYPALADVRLAAARGEVDGHCAIMASSLRSDLRNMFKSGQMRVIIQTGIRKHPEIPEVPNSFDLIATEEQRQVLQLVFSPWAFGRPVLAPPGVASERIAALRSAFERTMLSADLLAEADKLQMDIMPMTGGEIEKLVAQIYATPPAVVTKTRETLGMLKR